MAAGAGVDQRADPVLLAAHPVEVCSCLVQDPDVLEVAVAAGLQQRGEPEFVPHVHRHRAAGQYPPNGGFVALFLALEVELCLPFLICLQFGAPSSVSLGQLGLLVILFRP